MRRVLFPSLIAPLLALASPTVAQLPAAPTPAAAPVDPTRLAAARRLIDTIMPPATRTHMVDDMVRPMIANLQRTMTQDPSFAKVFDDDPRARDLFARFIQRQTDRSLGSLRSTMPGMWDAMARAYARRFDVVQMREIQAFFETPTGRLYMQQSLTMMSDPDVAAWQADTMRASLDHVQEDIAEFSRQVAVLSKDESK